MNDLSPHATIRPLDPAEYQSAIPALAAVLHACVHGGASVGFVLPFPLAEAEAFYRSLAPSVASADRLVFIAEQGARILGTAQLVLAGMPNGRHRAEVAKVLVHPAARRQGLAERLMRGLEAEALAQARTLLVLDTTTGRSADRLYRRLGYTEIGTIENYAADPDGTLHPTTIMAKDLVHG